MDNRLAMSDRSRRMPRMIGGNAQGAVSQYGPEPGAEAANRELEVRGPQHRGEHYLAWSRRGRARLGWYFLGFLLIVLAWAIGTLAVLLPGWLSDWTPASPAQELGLLTATFTFGFVAVPCAVRLVLRRPWWSLVTGWFPGPRRHLLLGGVVAAGAALVADLLVAPFAPLHWAAFRPGVWFPLAAVALVGFFVQAGFEELAFRGYLMQALASRTTRSALVIGVPAVLFGALHWGNLAAMGNNPLQLVPYVLMGATLGWAAWHTGSLWLPMGMHWANNTYATLAISVRGDVAPTGAPVSRDLGAMPWEIFLLSAVVQAGLQVYLVRRLCPRVPVTGGYSSP